MAKWQRLSRNKMSRVEEVYTRNCLFSTTVRHYLASYIESRPWLSYDVENPVFYEDMHREFSNFMAALHYKTKELRLSGDREKVFCICKPLEAEAANLYQTYQNSPKSFVRQMQALLKEEDRILETDSDLKMLPRMFDIMDDTVTEDTRLLVSFNELDRHKSNCDNKIQCLDTKAEYYILQQDKIQTMNSLYPSNMGQMCEKKMQMYSANLEANTRALRSLSCQMSELVAELVDQLKLLYQLLMSVQSLVIEEIDDWRDKQRMGLINGTPNPNLDYIEHMTCRLADALKSSACYYSRLKNNLLDQDTVVVAWHNDVMLLIQVLMTKCFIVEEQPPQVMKKDTRFSSMIRLIAGEKWGFAVNQPLVQVCLVNTEQVKTILHVQNNNLIEQMPSIPNCGTMVNGEKVMAYSSEKKTLVLQFKNLVLKKLQRMDRRSSELVTEEKFGVLFYCKVPIPFKKNYPDPYSTLTLAALSLPVTVIVHGNQSSAAEATIFWDNSFAPRSRESFVHPPEQCWGDLKQRLSDWFKKNTDRYLEQEAMAYLGMKVLNINHQNNLDAIVVRWQSFAKDPLLNRNFTFWEWLYGCMDLIKKCCMPIWRHGLIHGFISKTQTEHLLRNPLTMPHTFILRFSDSNTGMLSVAVKQQDQGVRNIIWNTKELLQHPLSNRILDPIGLQYLYPDIPKETKFKPFERVKCENVDGYDKDIIKTTIPMLMPVPPIALNPHNTRYEEGMFVETEYDTLMQLTQAPFQGVDTF